LHISKDEQKKRLEERLEDSTKHWKISENDSQEVKYWDKYVEAYEVKHMYYQMGTMLYHPCECEMVP
jgi:polyphosphate kinase 2 (PPK2 family)